MGCKCTEGCSSETDCCAGARDELARAVLPAAYTFVMALDPLALPSIAKGMGLNPGSATAYDMIACSAYKTADAMLKARNA